MLLLDDDRSTMEYISKLRKNKYIKCFFDGYGADRSVVADLPGFEEGWDLPSKWSGKQASISAGFLNVSGDRNSQNVHTKSD